MFTFNFQSFPLSGQKMLKVSQSMLFGGVDGSIGVFSEGQFRSACLKEAEKYVFFRFVARNDSAFRVGIPKNLNSNVEVARIQRGDVASRNFLAS